MTVPDKALAPPGALAERRDGGGRARVLFAVHLALIAGFVASVVPLLLFGLGGRVTVHVVIACTVCALVLVHLVQRRRTVVRLAAQLVRSASRAAHRRLAVSDAVLVFLMANVIASGILDLVTGQNNRLPLPGLANVNHVPSWHALASVVLICYLVAHVLRRRRRLRLSHIR